MGHMPNSLMFARRERAGPIASRSVANAGRELELKFLAILSGQWRERIT